MNPLVKTLLDIGPIAVFFIAYKIADGNMMTATAAFIPAVLVSIGVSYALARRVSHMLAVTGVIVLVFGGLTLWLNDATFIKIKPTIINALFALGLGFGLVRQQNYLKFLMEGGLPIDDEGWRVLALRCTAFFAFMALLNELVWRTQTESVWVTVKTFGYLPIQLAFFAVQVPLIRRHWIGGSPPTRTNDPAR